MIYSTSRMEHTIREFVKLHSENIEVIEVIEVLQNLNNLDFLENLTPPLNCSPQGVH